jgi:hypothetical protein
LKLVKTEVLIDKGNFSGSSEWSDIRSEIESTIKAMEWPAGSGKFTLFDQRDGNGVVPIKEMFVRVLKQRTRWKGEVPLKIPARVEPGPVDAATEVEEKLFAVEWETGNISSSHRAVNKLALGLLKGVLVGGVLITPTRKMYYYLTDRIGNFEELYPYFDVWRSMSVTDGLLAVMAVEQDGVSKGVEKFAKGTDGRALR